MDPGALRDAAQRLAAAAHRPLPFEADLRALQDEGMPTTAAVDGSHAVLVDNGCVWAVAVSAGAVAWPGPPPLPVLPEVHVALPDEAEAELAARHDALGLPPPRVRSAEAYAEALRGLAEARAAREALRTLPDDGLLLLDGALHGLPPLAQAFWAPVLAAAGPRALGVAKRSALAVGGVPLVRAVEAQGRRDLPGRAWAAPVPGQDGVFIARLHPRAPFAYRVDVTDERNLGRLLPLCRDAVYLGYPYPLALVHNQVALTSGASRDLGDRLMAAVRETGGPAAAAWLEDPHAMLDDNVPG